MKSEKVRNVVYCFCFYIVTNVVKFVVVLVSTDTAIAGCKVRHADRRGQEETIVMKLQL